MFNQNGRFHMKRFGEGEWQAVILGLCALCGVGSIVAASAGAANSNSAGAANRTSASPVRIRCHCRMRMPLWQLP